MASGNRKHFSCGHRGFGQYCHRCEFAEKLEKMAASKKHYVDHPAPSGKPRKWTIEAMLEEAKRLRSEGRR